jgi:hypothetical protein
MILLSVHYKLLNLQVAVELIGKTAANPNGDGLVKHLQQLQMMQYPINFFPDGTSSNAPSGILNKLLQKLVLILYCNRDCFRYWGVSTNSTIEVKGSNFEDAEAVRL